MKRGDLSTGISAITLFVLGWITVTTLFSVLDTQTTPNPKMAVKEPAGTGTLATTALVLGSIRFTTSPVALLGTQREPAPNAIPPSPSAAATATGILATVLFVPRS